MHPGEVASRRVTRVTHRCLLGAGRVVLGRFHQFRSQQRLLWQASAGVRERAIESHWRPLERRHDGTQPIALIASQRQACWSTTPRSKGASFTRPSVRARAPRPAGARLSRFVARAAKSSVRGWPGCGCCSARPGPWVWASRWRGAPPGGRCWPSCAGWSATARRAWSAARTWCCGAAWRPSWRRRRAVPRLWTATPGC